MCLALLISGTRVINQDRHIKNPVVAGLGDFLICGLAFRPVTHESMNLTRGQSRELTRTGMLKTPWLLGLIDV